MNIFEYAVCRILGGVLRVYKSVNHFKSPLGHVIIKSHEMFTV